MFLHSATGYTKPAANLVLSSKPISPFDVYTATLIQTKSSATARIAFRRELYLLTTGN